MTIAAPVRTPATWPLADVASLACGPPDTPRRARARTRLMISAWVPGTTVGDDAEMVASELISNAVQAGSAGEPLLLCLFCDRRYLLIEVRDAAPGIPVLRNAEAGDESGRGLVIVNELSLRWGCRPAGRGKAVYALMAVSLLPCPPGHR